MAEYYNNSIFWVETSKIEPNPFQPRREFEQKALEDLADSIRQYGILQPLTVTRKETTRPDGAGMDVSYELIAGERRLRASSLAGLQQVPVIIRKETDNKVKLELAIIENLQREDLNPIDRALAFEQLYKQFKLTHVEIGKKMGKSRVYVSNTLRLLALPEEIKQGLMQGRITEGHTRPLLMLTDRPQEQDTLYKEIMIKKLSVRDAERVARKIAQDRVRKKEFIIDPKIREFEKKLSENLGTRVQIEPKEKGGQITIDYFTIKDIETILASMKKTEGIDVSNMMERYIQNQSDQEKQDSLQETTPVVFHQGIEAPDKKQEQHTMPAPEMAATEGKKNLPSSLRENVSDVHTIVSEPEPEVEPVIPVINKSLQAEIQSIDLEMQTLDHPLAAVKEDAAAEPKTPSSADGNSLQSEIQDLSINQEFDNSVSLSEAETQKNTERDFEPVVKQEGNSPIATETDSVEPLDPKLKVDLYQEPITAREEEIIKENISATPVVSPKDEEQQENIDNPFNPLKSSMNTAEERGAQYDDRAVNPLISDESSESRNPAQAETTEVSTEDIVAMATQEPQPKQIYDRVYGDPVPAARPVEIDSQPQAQYNQSANPGYEHHQSYPRVHTQAPQKKGFFGKLFG